MNRQKEVLNALSEVLLFVLLMMNVELTSPKLASQQRTVREESKFDENSGCYYLQPGMPSKLVVSGDQLIANVTTDSDKQEDTMIQLLGEETDLQIYRGSWRENY